MIDQVIDYIEQNHMLTQKDRVLVGVSGGADSMCLLSVLMELSNRYCLTLFAVHINHGIRGLEADEDEAYVKDFCEQHQIKLKISHIQVRELSKKEGISEEEAGRNARYQAFMIAAKEFSCNKIAVAHHKRDTAETVLFHLFRGTGLRGVCGIPNVRDGIIRPLLFAEKSAIKEYLKSKNIAWRTDLTNYTNDYSRNKIRNHILSYVEKEINVKASTHIASFAMQMQEVYEFIKEESKKAYKDTVLVREGLSNGYTMLVLEKPFLSLPLVIQKELLFQIMEEFEKIQNRKESTGRRNITSDHLTSILELFQKPVSKQVSLPKGIVIKRSYEGIEIFKKEERNFINESDRRETDAIDSDHIKNNSIYAIEKVNIKRKQNILTEEELKESVVFELPFENRNLCLYLLDYKNFMRIPKNRYTKWFDYDKIGRTVEVRTKCESDYLQIHKDGGRKSLKSILIDFKVPRERRNHILVLATGNHVLFIPEIRASEGFYVDETTKRVLVAEVT